MPAPTLVPLPPTGGEPATVDRSPWWIGSSSSASLRVYLPGIGERHASITEREDGYYLSPMSGVTGIQVDGRSITGATRLTDAAVITLAPAARFEFVTGEPRRAPAPAAEEAPEPEYDMLEPSGRKRPWWKRRRRPRAAARVGFPLWGWAAIALILVAVGFGGMVLVRTIRSASDTAGGPPPLTEVEGRIYDSLMVESTRSVERGSTLLDIGLTEEAQRQFAEAITVLESDPTLSRNEWVRASINRITQAVIDIYNFKRLSPPSGMRPGGRLADLSKTLGSNLTSAQFLAAVDNVRSAFSSTYGDTVVVTGRDHPEHVSLYGPGSAMDIRVRNLTRPQVSFLVTAFGRMGIRVKDFSTDDILQRQIAAARARGWNDRAGTGLHLHIDRFRDRSDRWTVKPAD